MVDYQADPEAWLTGFLTVNPASTKNLLGWFSSLSALVRDARLASGRDLDTGQVLDPDTGRGTMWLGTVGHLMLFDQIGRCFEPAGTPDRPPGTQEPRQFVRALTDFAPELSEADISALYVLRCALAHEYALTNVRNVREGRPRLTHRFLLRDDDGDGANVVEHPLIPWSGNYADRSRRNQTTVNLRLLGDLAERVVARVQELHADGNLKIILDGGITELINRFGSQIR